MNMEFDQKGKTAFNVSLGKNNKWDVSETGFDKPLASFDTETNARNFARDIARSRKGFRLELGGEAIC
jgi:hypothetical protein